MFWRNRREDNEEGEAMYNWPTPPQYYPMMYPPQPMGPTSNNSDYVKFLKKELKLAKTKDDKKKEEKKEDKKIWWKRGEVAAALFFFSIPIATAWIGMGVICIRVIKLLVP